MFFLMYFFALLGLAAIGGIAWYAIQGDQIRIVVCVVTAMFLSCLVILCANADSSARGFANMDDEKAAEAAGVTEAVKWIGYQAGLERERVAHEAGLAREKKISDGLNTARTQGESIVRDSLKDPWSASIHTTPAHFVKNHVVVCGTVNAKNGFNAYTGDKLFAVYVDTGYVVMEGMDRAMQEDWQTDCG